MDKLRNDALWMLDLLAGLPDAPETRTARETLTAVADLVKRGVEVDRWPPGLVGAFREAAKVIIDGHGHEAAGE